MVGAAACLGNETGCVWWVGVRCLLCSQGSPMWLGTRREPGRAGAKPGGAGLGGRAEGLLFLHGLESNPGSSLQTEEQAGLL